MRNKKVYCGLCLLLLSLISFFSYSPTKTNACYLSPICPGDQVIDVSRLEQSVQTTVQAVTKALQTLEMYEQRFKKLTASLQLGQISSLLSSVKNVETQVLSSLKGPMNAGQQPINPIPGQSSTAASAWKDFMQPTDENLAAAAVSEQNEAMRTVQENANYDALSVLRKQNENLFALNQEMNNLSAIQEDGSQGTQQNAVAARALFIKMMINNTYADAAIDIATQTRTKGEATKEEIVMRKLRDARIGSFDPYNPSAHDKALNPAQSAIGFPKF